MRLRSGRQAKAGGRARRARARKRRGDADGRRATPRDRRQAAGRGPRRQRSATGSSAAVCRMAKGNRGSRARVPCRPVERDLARPLGGAEHQRQAAIARPPRIVPAGSAERARNGSSIASQAMRRISDREGARHAMAFATRAGAPASSANRVAPGGPCRFRWQRSARLAPSPAVGASMGQPLACGVLPMKTHVRALVVGGGAVGTGIAYHLAKAGWDNHAGGAGRADQRLHLACRGAAAALQHELRDHPTSTI